MKIKNSLFPISYFLFPVLLIVHLSALANLRFEAWPEMLVYPYLNLNGFLQYRDIIHPYPPLGVWFLSGFFKVFEISVLNLKLLTWGIILLTDSLIFYIARKRWGSKSALAALGFFILWQPLLDGNGLWFDLMLVPILLISYYRQSPWFFAVSFFTKQSAIWLLPLFVKHWKKLFLGALSLFIISCFLFLTRGTAADYLFWSWRFPFTLFPNMPGHKDLGNWRLWLVGLAPLSFTILTRIFMFKKPPRFSTHEPFWWMILSTPFVFPRFGLFHLQPALAFAALTLAQSVKSLGEKRSARSPLLLAAIGYTLVASFFWQRQIKLYWHQPTRFFEPETTQAAQKVSKSTVSQKPILFVNAPDQIMILAHRFPPKPWVDTFPWYLELTGLQPNLVSKYSQQEIQAVIWSPYQNQSQYIPGSYQPKELQKFVEQHFPRKQEILPDLLILMP